MFATLRIAFGVAWKITLTAELFGGRGGLGYLFNRARQNYDTALILVVIVVIVAFVFSTDRLVFVGMYTLAPDVLEALKIVKPETVLRWHRAGFRFYWRWKARSRGGRPSIPA